MSWVVLRHALDEAAGVYRLIVAQEVRYTRPGDPLPPDEDGVKPEPEPVEAVTYEHEHEVVFAADDARWFAGGRRRPLARVAPEQRRVVAKQLADADAAQAAEAERVAAMTHELPGGPRPL